MHTNPGHPAPATAPARSVQVRVSLVLFGTAMVLAAVMMSMQWVQHRQVEELFRERASEAKQSFGRILDSRARPAQLHADDYTRWDEFVEFVHKPDAKWAEINIEGGIPTFGLDVAWVFDVKGKLVHTAIPGEDRTIGVLPVRHDVLTRSLAEQPVRHFFATTEQGLLEVWTSSIVPSEDLDRKTRPQGFYVVGYLWTPERTAELAEFAGGDVQFTPTADNSAGTTGVARTGRIEVVKQLPGIDGRPIAGMLFGSQYPVAQQVDAAMRSSATLALAGALLSLIAVWWAMSHWVGRPLRNITLAMRDENAGSLAKIRPRRDEMGEVARLVDEFFAQRDRLIEARQAAEGASQTKSNFLANISHELRTPMHGILSFSRFGLRDSMTASREDLHDNFKQINECGEGLLVLLNALLDLSKLEAGRMAFAYSEVLLTDVVDVAIDEFRSLYREREIEVRTDFEPGVAIVVADRAQLIQVMRNLLSNAAKFTPAGGHVRVRLVADGAVQRVSLEDSGVGIPAGEEATIFNKFTQASHTNSRSGGTGLGLAITREIIEAHEGRVWAENREGGGARLVFELPVAGPAAAGEARANEATSDANGATPVQGAPDGATRANDRWRTAA